MAKLLIVDDDRAILDILSELFSDDHLCHTVATAEEALGRLSRDEYDVIVTDLVMLGMSGEVLLGFIKANCPGTPVLFISGSTDEEREKRLRVKGAFDYLQKPFKLTEVFEKVALALEHRRRRQSAT